MNGKKQPLFDRQPPVDLEAELGVLGSILLLPDVIDDVSFVVGPEDFHDEVHQTLYRHLLAMHSAGGRIDTTLLMDRLQASGEYRKTVDAAYLMKILQAVPNAAHAVYYAEIVRDKAMLRRVIDRCTDMLRRAYGNVENVADLVSEAETLFTSIQRAEVTEARLIGDIAREAYERIATAQKAPTKPGIMSGISALDSGMGPIMPGEMAVIAARPGGGKTAIGMQIAEHNADRARQVLFVSLEMKDLELVNRSLCQRAQIDSRELRQGAMNDDDLSRLRSATGTLEGSPLRVWAPPRRANAGQIRSVARRIKARSGLDLLLVDYIGRVRPMPEHNQLPRHQQVGEVTGALKDMAKELDVPVIALCQLNRNADNQRPVLKDLKESGDIEQDADIVIFPYHPDTPENRDRSEYVAHDAELIVAKHRHGAKGAIPVFWTPWQTRFTCEKEWDG